MRNKEIIVFMQQYGVIITLGVFAIGSVVLGVVGIYLAERDEKKTRQTHHKTQHRLP